MATNYVDPQYYWDHNMELPNDDPVTHKHEDGNEHRHPRGGWSHTHPVKDYLSWEEQWADDFAMRRILDPMPSAYMPLQPILDVFGNTNKIRVSLLGSGTVPPSNEVVNAAGLRRAGVTPVKNRGGAIYICVDQADDLTYYIQRRLVDRITVKGHGHYTRGGGPVPKGEWVYHEHEIKPDQSTVLDVPVYDHYHSEIEYAEELGISITQEAKEQAVKEQVKKGPALTSVAEPYEYIVSTAKVAEQPLVSETVLDPEFAEEEIEHNIASFNTGYLLDSFIEHWPLDVSLRSKPKDYYSELNRAEVITLLENTIEDHGIDEFMDAPHLFAAYYTAQKKVWDDNTYLQIGRNIETALHNRGIHIPVYEEEALTGGPYVFGDYRARRHPNGRGWTVEEKQWNPIKKIWRWRQKLGTSSESMARDRAREMAEADK